MSGTATGTQAVLSQIATRTQTVDTGFGRVTVDPSSVRLGELFVTDEGVEVEVVGLEPLLFAEAPEEDEDWGE